MRVIYTIAGVLLFALTTGALSISDFMNQPEPPPEVAQRTRFERAAQEMCGIQAAWADLGNGVIQCLTHHGRKTRKGEIK